MKVTKHAKKRCCQRGIKIDLLDLIYNFGTKIDEDEDGIKFQITDKIRTKLIDLLDKSKNKIIITDKFQENIITVYAK